MNRSDCKLPPHLAVALASAVRTYYSGRWPDHVALPQLRAVDHAYDEPGGTTLLDTMTREQMQAGLERLKLFYPRDHRMLLAGLGNKLDPKRAVVFYLALCRLWTVLRALDKQGGE